MSSGSTSGPQWPPNSRLSTVVCSSKDAVLTTSASCRIAAPASLVWAVLRETSKYQWNTFCPEITIRSQPDGVDITDKTLQLGTHFTMSAVMDEKKPDSRHATLLYVTDVSTPDKPSTYVPEQMLGSESEFSSDSTKTYRLAWSLEGPLTVAGLKTERFHEIIIINENECEVHTWECQGGLLARTVKWMFQTTMQRKFDEWCQCLKAESEKQFQAKS